MALFDFEKLDTYQKAINFSKEVYKATARFPAEERYGMASQFRRAAVSISLNIAEGVGRHSKTERQRFYRIARGSLYECVPLTSLSHELGYFSDKSAKRFRADLEELAKMLNGLISALSR